MNNSASTTINVAVEKDVHHKIRVVAAEEDTKIQTLVNDILKMWLSAKENGQGSVQKPARSPN